MTLKRRRSLNFSFRSLTFSPKKKGNVSNRKLSIPGRNPCLYFCSPDFAQPYTSSFLTQYCNRPVPSYFVALVSFCLSALAEIMNSMKLVIPLDRQIDRQIDTLFNHKHETWFAQSLQKNVHTETHTDIHRANIHRHTYINRTLTLQGTQHITYSTIHHSHTHTNSQHTHIHIKRSL